MYYLGLLLEELTRPGQFPWKGTVGNLQPVPSIFRPDDILTCVCVFGLERQPVSVLPFFLEMNLFLDVKIFY